MKASEIKIVIKMMYKKIKIELRKIKKVYLQTKEEYV